MISITAADARDAVADGRSLYSYVEHVLGITGDEPKRRAVNDLGALICEVSHPEFVKFGEQLRAKGFTVETSFFGDDAAEIEVMNFPDRVTTTSTFGAYGIGLNGKYLGRVRANFFRSQNSYTYEGWSGKYNKRERSRKHSSVNWETVVKQFAIDARMPTEADYTKMAVAMAAERARNTRRDRAHKLDKLAASHGARAMEILASANIAIPDDFKQAMSDYLDLIEGDR